MTVVTVSLTPKQAGHVAGCICADVSNLVRGCMVNPATRSCMDDVRATLDRHEEWLDQLDQVGDDGRVTWTAPKPEVAAAVVDLLAKGMDKVLTTDILERGDNALEHIPGPRGEWLSMAETAITIRDQLEGAGNGAVS